MMFRPLVFALLYISVNGGTLRIPKIYNALISSDENLSPSHTYPIIEPVLRTTALGIAFPPLLTGPLPVPEGTQQLTDKKVESVSETTLKADQKEENPPPGKQEIPHPQLSYHGTLYPLAFDPTTTSFYSHGQDILFPALPYYEQPLFVHLGPYFNKETAKEKKEVNPAVNFKKNPEIPDVPPPPLPIKDDKKEKE